MDREISDHMRYEKCRLKKQIALQPGIQDLILSLVNTNWPHSKFTTFKVILRDTTVLLRKRRKKFSKFPIAFCPMNSWFQTKLPDYIVAATHRKPWPWKRTRHTIILVTLDIIACFIFLNRWFSSKVWRPFYRAINVLKKFDLQKGGRVLFQRSNVEEFQHPQRRAYQADR